MGDDFRRGLEERQLDADSDHVRACVLHELRGKLDPQTNSVESVALANLPELTDSEKALVERYSAGLQLSKGSNLDHVYGYDPADIFADVSREHKDAEKLSAL